MFINKPIICMYVYIFYIFLRLPFFLSLYLGISWSRAEEVIRVVFISSGTLGTCYGASGTRGNKCKPSCVRLLMVFVVFFVNGDRCNRFTV